MSQRRVLFTGARDWEDGESINAVVKTLTKDDLVIHGGAPGADTIAGKWAYTYTVPVLVFHAEWEKYGNAAGPIRNQRMIDEGKPTEAHAFPGPNSKGTWDMVRKLRAASIPVTVHE